ncbi:MAG: hypothetical protein BroJett018_39910 [Chloroflexota bacterium]|nr:MAG: hypothetical protein BroJett018_39910 [Chloroflexota bacterium]
MIKREWHGVGVHFGGTQPVASVLKTPYPCDIRGIVLNRIPDKPPGVGTNGHPLPECRIIPNLGEQWPFNPAPPTP